MGITTDRLTRALKQTKNLASFLKNNREAQVVPPLPEHLAGLLAAKGRKKSEVIKASQLPVNYAYQMFDGRRSPSRDKLLQLAFAFPLSLQETETLLHVAGTNGLYIKNRRDSIILFALESGYGINRLNELLEKEGEPFLG